MARELAQRFSMGLFGSKPNKGPATSLEKDVLEAVRAQFLRFTGGKSHLDRTAFETFSSGILDDHFRQSIYKSLKAFSNGSKLVTENSFIRFAELILGDFDQQAECITNFELPLQTAVKMVVSSFFLCEKCDNSAKSCQLLVDYILRTAPSESTASSVSSWLSRDPTFPSILGRVFKLLFTGADSSILPALSSRSVLSPAAVVAITLQLPMESRLQWTLMFSSRAHGESFTKLVNAVNATGSSLIVIESMSDRVFGCFANDGFACGPSHTGDSRCFLFEDRNVVAVHSATGFNTNFAYLNTQQVSLPNGLGIGGAGDNWSLFLREDFSHGTSAANISTFEKCWLAGESEFKVKSVEAWRIGEEKKRKRYDSEGNEIEMTRGEISALDLDPEAKAILELAGKKTYSDGFREPPEED